MTAGMTVHRGGKGKGEAVVQGNLRQLQPEREGGIRCCAWFGHGISQFMH